MSRRRIVALGLAWSLAWPAAAHPLTSGERTIAVGEATRSYILHLPPHPARPAPLLFVFHGGGGRPQAIERKTGMDALADEHGFIAVYPAGAAAPSGRGGTWNVGGPLHASSADDVAFVQAILREVETATPVDPTRVYAAGHSMGGIFAYRLACEMSDTFAAIAAVSSTMVQTECRPASPVALLHIHGTADERIPFKGGTGRETASGRSWPAPEQGIATWRRLDGCSGDASREADGATRCETYKACRATVEFCVVSGGAHPWPADASERVWSFLSAHPKTR